MDNTKLHRKKAAQLIMGMHNHTPNLTLEIQQFLRETKKYDYPFRKTVLEFFDTYRIAMYAINRL